MIERKDLRRHYIKEMFGGRLEQLKTKGIWFNGFTGEGEYKRWHRNGQPERHCYYKNGKIDGEYKRWYDNGQLLERRH